MNSWLKLALYSLIGIIIGSFALGLLTPSNGMNANPGSFQMNANYQMPMYNDANGFQRGMQGMGWRMRGMFDRMPGNMGQGQMNGGQMNNGMGGM